MSINDLTTITSGSANWHHANVTVEYADYFKCGRIVIVSFAFTVNTEISGTTASILSGFPNNTGSTYKNRYAIMERNATYDFPLLVTVNGGGVLVNAYTKGVGVPVGTYQGSVIYFT